MVHLVIKNVIIDDTNQLYQLEIREGRFTHIAPQNKASTVLCDARVLDAYGRVAVPGFVEAHIHLDKALIADRLPNKSGTLQEALQVTAQLKATFTRDDILQRAEHALRMMIQKGTTHVRTHAEFDPVGGFHGFEVIMYLKEKYREYVDMQVVAFPQEGIVKAPGTEQLMRRAMELGADVVGGIPYNDTDVDKHLDIVFSLAKEFDKPIDLHQDFADTCDRQTIERVAQRVIAEGYQGKVSVGHLTSLADMEPDALQRTIDLIRQAGICVMSLPMTDLHLGGRTDTRNVRRALTPIRQLRDGGVTVALATNNIRNPFTPYGNGDLVQVAMLAIPVAHLGGADDLPTVLPMITTKAAQACGFAPYGIKQDFPGTLVLLDATRYQEAIIAVPKRLLVVKNGRIILEDRSSYLVDLPEIG